MTDLKPADLTFGEAMAKLEQLVHRLENEGDMGLEQALALYEQGAALATDCQQRLASAKLRVAEIQMPAAPSSGEDGDAAAPITGRRGST